MELYDNFDWEDFDIEEDEYNIHPGLIELDKELTKHIFNGVPFPLPGMESERQFGHAKVIIHINKQYDDEYRKVLKKFNIESCGNYYDYNNNVYYFIHNNRVSFIDDNSGEEYIKRVYPNNKVIEIV